MGELFLKLLNMSVTAGWFILAVICVRFVFRKTPKWIICLLWGLVAIRLICPFSVESTWSLLPGGTDPIKTNAVVAGEVKEDIPYIDSKLGIVENTINPILARSFDYDQSDSAAPLQVYAFAGGIIWSCGMGLLILYSLVSLFRLYDLVREAIPYRDSVLICDAVKSPFILGLIRPKIYMSAGLSSNEMDYIMAHEHAHLKRRDHLWKPFGYFLLCIYWFNPLCWVAYILFCRDIELACDEKVIKGMDIQNKKEYSRTLLACACQRKSVVSCPLAFGEVGVKERVKSVLNYKKPAFWAVLVSIAVCVIIAVCFLTTSPKTYRIRITIPAGSTEAFCYSDEEISPKGNRLTLYAGEGLGDSEVVLKPIEVKEENTYEPTYITPGMPVKMKVEKGAWFQIGVSVQNPASEDRDVYVEVKNVNVRIADIDTVNEHTGTNGGATEPEAEMSEWVREEINVERYDVTHDGVPDYIVSSLWYDPAFVDPELSQEERIAEQANVSVIWVEVYEGKADSEELNEAHMLWSQGYSGAHTGNGQLSIVSIDGEDWLLSSSLYEGQGFATLGYEVFSLDQNGEKNILDEQSIDFEMGQGGTSDAFAEFKTALSQYTGNGILIAACDIEFGANLIRTEKTPYVPADYYNRAFDKF